MMTPEQAVTLVGEFASVQCELLKEANTKRGCTKRSLKREAQVATALFEGLTGQKPTAQQLSDMEVK